MVGSEDAMILKHDRTFEPHHGTPVPVAAGVVRLTAPNPGPFTFFGTNAYLVGTDGLAVIDPGPDDPAQVEALLAAIGGRPVSHVLVTHTHRDHSPAAATIVRATGAITVAGGPHRPARALRPGEDVVLDAAGDMAFRPDVTLADGEAIETAGGRLVAVATPGHCANHLAFALEGPEPVLFSGDHVMAWSTTVVAPPDGSMADYMSSLDHLLEREDPRYLPGHGGPVEAPAAYVRALRAHRLQRAASILDRLGRGDRTIPEIVAALYAEVDPRLHRAAGMSVLAHLEDLESRGLVRADPHPAVGARFERA